MTRIDPCGLFKAELPKIQKPARYLGGESGSVVKETAVLRIGLCFPDLYEVGMANNAMRILYAGLNGLEGVACERVFSVAPDYEASLRKAAVPLYGLESGTPASDFDILAFTVGYELAATNILTVLDLSGIPLYASERGEGQPLVIAGGPAITNPAPYARILDAVWIGEAEDAFFSLVAELREAKRGGVGRSGLLERILKEPSAWAPGKKARRHVFESFPDAPYRYSFPVPVVKPIQDHGVVEIMRGCPNGCRFCHAGYFYRPRRLRSVDRVLEDVEAQVRVAGHREISLSSLSSGDYPGIASLVAFLNREWSREGVSFQLPSLKVESFPLELIEDLSGTRKSGLTFAVETPLEQWQLTLNKEASLEKIGAILREAEGRGYRVAKFYFMVGLPLPDVGVREEEAIVEFIRAIAAAAPGMRINVTVATFVPKPHTPFQWSAQLPPEEAAARIYYVKDAFRNNQKVKISYHAPFLSWLEGLVARGDESVGELIVSAFRHGARFDAWDDLFRKDAWLAALEATGFDASASMSERPVDGETPWSGVSLGVSRSYLAKELERSRISALTGVCTDECASRCGACSDGVSLADDEPTLKRIEDLLRSQAEREGEALSAPGLRQAPAQGNRFRAVFRYEKRGAAAFFAHHEVQSMLCSALERSGLSVAYSQGFNPMPRLEISEPLSLGFESLEEYGVTILAERPSTDCAVIMAKANAHLHGEMQIQEMRILECQDGVKFASLSSAHWGSLFELDLMETGSPPSSFAAHFETVKARNAVLAEGSASYEGTTISLLLPFAGSRELGLPALFEGAFGLSIRDSRVSVKRTRQFAKSQDGRGRTGYLDRYR